MILNRRGLLMFTGGLALAVLTASAFYFRYPEYSRIAAARLIQPFGLHTWTGLDVKFGDMNDVPHRVGIGQPFVLKGVLSGVIPQSARIEIDSGVRSEKIVAVKTSKDEPGGEFVAPLDMTQYKGTFKFRVRSGDGVFPRQPGAWHTVDVLPTPRLVDLDGVPSPQIEVDIPAYTDEPTPKELTPGTRHLDLLSGSSVVLRGAADRPLAEAFIHYRPENPNVVLSSLVFPVSMAAANHPLAMLTSVTPLTTVSNVPGGSPVWGKVPGQLDAEGSKFRFEFTPWVQGAYVLHIRDADRLYKEYESDLRITHDPLPRIDLKRPATSLTVLPDAEVGFRFLVDDELFAVKSVFLEYQRKAPEGHWLDKEPRRVPIFDAGQLGQGLPALLRPWGPALKGIGHRLRPKRMEVTTTWALKNQFKEGETVLLQVCADDHCDLFGAREAGRSIQITLNIVGKVELAKAVDDKLKDVQGQVEQIRRGMEKLMDQTKDLRNKKEFTSRDVDALNEIKDKQKDLTSRVGRLPDENLRDELSKLQQMLKDNKLDHTDAKRQAAAIKNMLDRIAEKDLQNIEPAIETALRNMLKSNEPQEQERTDSGKTDPGKTHSGKKDPMNADPMKGGKNDAGENDAGKNVGGKNDAGKNDPGKKNAGKNDAGKSNPGMNDPGKKDAGKTDPSKGPKDQPQDDTRQALEEVEKLQARAKRDLDDLAKLMNPWAAMQQVKADTRELLLQQSGLKQDVEQLRTINDKMLADTAGLSDQQKTVLRERAREEVNRRSDQQKQLAGKAEKLLELMRTMEKSQREKGDKENARRLAESAKIGQDAAVPQKMQEAHLELRNQTKPKIDTTQKQEKIVEKLEKMLAALEKDNAQGAARMQEDVRKSQKDVDKLEDRLRELHQLVNDAKKIEDQEERLQKMQKLAREFEELKQEMEEKARQLSRLEEPQAAKEIDRAAELLDQVVKDLSKGDNPQEKIEEAEERVDQAQQQLQQMEEELARERLAAIGDQLKGLKERQDEAVTRSEELHSKLMKRRSWTPEMVNDTLQGQVQTQEGLAREARDLKEKIKQARVFEHILDRAGQAMEKAAERMKDRQTTARDEGRMRDPLDKNAGSLEQEELDDEKERNNEILRYQKQASQKLDRLLNAINDELAKKPAPKKQQQQVQNEGEPKEQQGGMKAQDGIPPVAQLKALRAEQMEVNSRTKEISEAKANPQDLTPAQRREIEELQADQGRILELFQQIIAPPENKGELP